MAVMSFNGTAASFHLAHSLRVNPSVLCPREAVYSLQNENSHTTVPADLRNSRCRWNELQQDDLPEFFVSDSTLLPVNNSGKYPLNAFKRPIEMAVEAETRSGQTKP